MDTDLSAEEALWTEQCAMLTGILRAGLMRRSELSNSEGRKLKLMYSDRKTVGKNLGYLRRRVLNRQVFWMPLQHESMIGISRDNKVKLNEAAQKLVDHGMVVHIASCKKFPEGALALTDEGYAIAKRLAKLEKL